MFGLDILDNDLFVRMILGIDQQQTLTMLNGLVYHTLFLDAFAGRTQSLGVLNQLVYAFGMIGFIFLALQRSLWKPSIIISWLALVVLLILGARGSDVLFTPLDRDGARFLQVLQSDKFREVVTGADNAVDTIRRMSGLSNSSSEITSEGGATVSFPVLGDMLTNVIEQQKIQVNAVGGFTPMVYTLYIFNTMKRQLLEGLALDMNVDILSRTGIAQKVGAGKLNPSTDYLLQSFTNMCMEGPVSALMLGQGHVRNAPAQVGQFKLPPDGRTVQQELTDRKFNYASILDQQRRYFDDRTVPTMQKSFVGMPVAAMPGTFDFSIPPALKHNIRATVSGASDYSDSVIKQVNDGIRLGAPTETYKAIRDNVMRSAAPEDEEFLKQNATMVLSVYKMSAYKYGEDDSESDKRREPIEVSNCWELYEKFHEHFQENFGISEVYVRLGKKAYEESLGQAGLNSDGKLVLNPGGGKDEGTDQLLASLNKKCAEACTTLSSGANATCPVCPGGNCGTSINAPTYCLSAMREFDHTKALIENNALNFSLGKMAAVDANFRDPSQQFSSKIRSTLADAGDFLGPIALWFFALFGGFAAGAYGAIVPSFMNFALMMIFAISPFMFMMGVLMPGWAPQIILTPIVIIAYIKLVEIMFVLVGVIFTALRIGLENAGLISEYSWFLIFQGDNTFNAMYDIMVGMAYTSMFAVAGFMIAGIRSPEKLAGALASYGDKVGNISGKEALQIGATVTAAGKGIKKVGGFINSANKGSAVLGQTADYMKEKGVVGGLMQASKATLGSYTADRKEAKMSMQANLDRIDETNTKYEAKQEAATLPPHSPELEAAKRRADRRADAGKKFMSAVKVAGMDKRNTQEPKFTDPQTGIMYEGSAPADQAVGKLSSVIQKAEGLNVEQAEIKAQNLIFQAQQQAKEAATQEKQQWDQNNPDATDADRRQKHKDIDTEHQVLDGGEIDRENKKAITNLKVDVPAIKAYLDQHAEIAKNVFSDKNGNSIITEGRARLEGDLKTAGAGNQRQQSAAVGRSADAGKRPTFTEDDAKVAKTKANKNGWDLEPKE